jgi:hypothetical protein
MMLTALSPRYGDCLPHRHDVGLDAEMLARKNLPGPTEPARDFVHHQQRTIPSTELLHLRHE